jgi:hypothetical protein
MFDFNILQIGTYPEQKIIKIWISTLWLEGVGDVGAVKGNYTIKNFSH